MEPNLRHWRMRPLLRSMLLAALAVWYVIDGGHGRR